ncbi:helix-turn-helix domain-containing protein [Deminuibacter soli]|uniref:Helix-turn-helix domain-containing protein n=2 Tax=Deminuibacter soli TaxID=2291815 RepID=A0A3E1NKI9_9BACT|nr:helix-turn-helix domain-containing protein [Deminuibacter soli]
MQTFHPSPALRPYIQSFLVIESEESRNNTVLPGLSVMLAFRYSGSASYHTVDENTGTTLAPAVITGLRKTARLIHYAPHTANLVVQFTPGGAASLFKLPMHELFNESLSLDLLLPASELQNVEEQLALATTTRQRIAIAEAYMLSQLRDISTPPLVQHAVQHITHAQGNISIKSLLSDLPTSRDVFEKKFRHFTGTTPKQFAGIVRLRHLITQHDNNESLTRMALSAGYYDQAHFIKDFRSFTGKAPRAFFSNPVYW